MANERHRAKFRAHQSNRCQDMAVCPCFKMAAVRCHGFLKVRNCNCPYPLEGRRASSRQISCRSVKPLRKYGRFSMFFKMAAVRHLLFLKVGNFNYPYPSDGQYASSCQIPCRRSNHWGDLAVFRFFKIAAVRHVGSLKVLNFNCPYPSESQSASPSQTLCRSVKPLRRYCRYFIFQNGGRPPSWIF